MDTTTDKIIKLEEKLHKSKKEISKIKKEMSILMNELNNYKTHEKPTYIIFYEHYTEDDWQHKIDGYKIAIVYGNENLKKELYAYYKYCYFMCDYIFDDIFEKESEIDCDDDKFNDLSSKWFYEKYDENKIMSQSINTIIAGVFEFIKKYLNSEKLNKIVKIMEMHGSYVVYE